MHILLSYIFILIPLAVIDALWLTSMAGVYKKYLCHLFISPINMIPVIVFYPIYAFGIYFLVVKPLIHIAGGVELLSLGKVFAQAFVLGFVAYAAYDLTNHATLKDWPLFITVMDMLWGAFVTGTTATIGVFLMKTFLK